MAEVKIYNSSAHAGEVSSEPVHYEESTGTVGLKIDSSLTVAKFSVDSSVPASAQDCSDDSQNKKTESKAEHSSIGDNLTKACITITPAPNNVKNNSSAKRQPHGLMRVRRGEYPADEHPLETGWQFWYDRRRKELMGTEDYAAQLHGLGDFTTVEGFYRYFSYLESPSKVTEEYNIQLFRRGFKPMWEELPNGGCWVIRFVKPVIPRTIDKLWENLVLTCIGEGFELPELIGVVLSPRKREVVISIWNDGNQNGDKIKKIIEEKLRIFIRGVPPSTALQYKDFRMAAAEANRIQGAANFIHSTTPDFTCSDPATCKQVPPYSLGMHRHSQVFAC